MIRRALLIPLAVTIGFLAVVNLLASLFYWYHLMWWFDMAMHFLGGLSVFYLSALLLLPALKRVSPKRYLFESILGALLLGVLWEALEFSLHVRFGSPDFILQDSFSDVFFDLAGAFLGAICTLPALKKYTNQSA